MIDKLLEYQKEDCNLREIEITLSSSKERKAAIEAKKFLEGVEESIKVLEIKAEQLNNALDLAKVEHDKLLEQKGELDGAMATVSDENEANYLAKKAEELIGKLKAISQTFTQITADMQTVLGEYASLVKKFKATQAEYAENAKKYSELKESVLGKRTEIEAKLEEIKKQVDPSLMARYQKKREGKMYPIVYEVTSNVCGACNMELPMAVQTRLKNGEVIECDQCGRMLYKK